MVGLAKGCMTDYEAGKELVDKLKQGQMLLFESVDADDLPVNLRVPLAEFASAYDGPARDPRVIEESRLSQEEMKVMLERPRMDPHPVRARELQLRVALFFLERRQSRVC